ncbi:MAG: penicillin-binding protein [Oscillospiraceae bacterium]|jgi:peptidoglycan glycosyltransferase|nr:penicillin-binding protein [Oscillospiraceae bacterium]
MNKVRTRAFSLIILIAIAAFGMGFYIIRLFIYGGEWASAPFNATAYRAGVLAVGTVTDRNGVILADVTDGKRTFAESERVRRATLHAVGDRDGNVGTGALTVYAPQLMRYNFITGSYSMSGTGRSISLTIDSGLNAAALRALDGRNGVVMVSNYKTGEVLCMVSSPTFDPDNPPANVDTPAYEGVYVNRAIQSVFTPGSTFKLVTATAAIEQVSDIYDRVFLCTGELKTDRGTLTCPREHGSIGFERGMQVSCNVVYGELALIMGADIMAQYAAKLGLSERTTVGGITTAKGNFDKAEQSTADLAWSGVGQFNNTVCPAAMLRFVGAVANDGNAVSLQLLKSSSFLSVQSATTKRLLDRSTAAQLGYIIEVENRDNFPGLEIYAKSGTAQVGGDKDPHAWYVGYITNTDYPLAFVVMVENGGGGTAVAAPIASRVLQEAIGR